MRCGRKFHVSSFDHHGQGSRSLPFELEVVELQFLEQIALLMILHGRFNVVLSRILVGFRDAHRDDCLDLLLVLVVLLLVWSCLLLVSGLPVEPAAVLLLLLLVVGVGAWVRLAGWVVVLVWVLLVSLLLVVIVVIHFYLF